MEKAEVATAFERLVQIMDELREQCPWDRKQTIQSLRSLTMEETYELAEAITSQDWKGIQEELGDLLLHIVFYARIAREQDQFTIEDVIHSICEKLIFRHPHIYGTEETKVVVKDEEEVKKNWEKLKLKEGKSSVLGGVPVSLPATIKALRLQEKARQVGFEWHDKEAVWQKVEEEKKELEEAVASGDGSRMEEEYGDLVFSLINYARFLQIDPENALEKTNRKFSERFIRMEQEALSKGRNLTEMSLQEMDAIWNTIKKQNFTG